jgi:CheY-like chemotaxis protein
VIPSVLIFLVEDEISIQELLEVTLEEGGFAVAKACSGEEALAMLEADGANYRALITDVNLASRKKITGWDVARRARQLNDQLPVVYMTGGNGHEWASQGVPNSTLVSKPFAPAQECKRSLAGGRG